MKKIISLFVMLMAMLPAAFAQSQSSTATQTISLNLEPVIQIMATTSENVDINFNSVTQYANGVESGAQQFRIHSNKGFMVNVKTDAAAFTYSGAAYPAPQMPVENTLYLAVSSNNTGGNVAGSFSSYSSLSSIPKDLLLNCVNGADKLFAVNYKATPGNNYPAGEYTIGVVYTATQP